MWNPFSKESDEGGKEFMRSFSRTPDAVLIDVRTKSEYDEGHINGAVNIDSGDPHFVTTIEERWKGKTLFLYCRSGGRSGRALSLLRNRGFTAEHLEGGVMEYPELITSV